MVTPMRSIDWSKTALGPVETWSETLRMMAQLIESNRLQMFLWWGPQFIQIHNGALGLDLGPAHPLSIGRPASACWAEHWHILGPLIERPFRGGPASWTKDIFLPVSRKGFMEETHWTIACSPVLDDAAQGGIGGVIGVMNEITEQIVAERRVHLLRDLGVHSSEPKTAAAACALLAETIAHHSEDVPFALIYLIDEGRRNAHLAGAAGIAMGTVDSPREVRLDDSIDGSGPWPLAAAVRCESMEVVADLGSRLQAVPPGPWPDPPRVAAVCVIPSGISRRVAGLLVLGVSSHLTFDDDYRGFFDLVASQVASAIANARLYEQERKRAEDALQDREGRFRRFFDLGLIGMAITSATKVCLEANDELCRILGYSREELLLKTWSEMTHPDDLASDLSQFQRVMRGDIDSYSKDKRWIRKDGSVINTLMATQCVRGADGAVDYFVGLVLDTTDRKRAEEELRRARNDLARVARKMTMGELSASIAHEMNQPLAAINAHARACRRWLEKSPPDMREAQLALEGIASDAVRAADIIGGIKRLLRGGQPHMVPLDVDVVIREVASLMEAEARVHQVILSIESSPPLPLVIADRIQLGQVILNLMMNAVEAMEMVSQRPRMLDIRSECIDGEVVVSVCDSGVGLDPANHHRIFDAFYSTKGSGMGMGLAICQSIVEAHGGRISVADNDGPGETFRFTLPLQGPSRT